MNKCIKYSIKYKFFSISTSELSQRENVNIELLNAVCFEILFDLISLFTS